MPQKPLLLTTAIDYASGAPHIGHLFEKVAADAVARFWRQRGREVFFLGGTDWHGAKIQRKAAAEGKEPAAFAKEKHELFRAANAALGVSFDRFLTTEDADHRATVEEFWKKVAAAGDLEKKKFGGLYCVGCESFKKEKDLVDGKCPDHDAEPEWLEEENWFFAQDRRAPAVQKAIESGALEVLPGGRKNEILSFIRGGVEGVSVSRAKEKLSWGLPIPGDDSQVIYVWFDALINYLTAAESAGGWENFEKIHVVGRDILRQHALLWPAMLLSAELPLPGKIIAHGLLTVDGQKMSKTIGNVVAPAELLEKFSRDATRWILLREVSFFEDGDFSWQRAEVRQKELANGLGNLLSRTLALAEKAGIKKGPLAPPAEILNLLKEARAGFEEKLPAFRFREALEEVEKILAAADGLLSKEKPWELLSAGEEERAREILAAPLEMLRQLSWLLTPILPEKATEIARQLGVSGEEEKPVVGDFKKGEVLFPRD